MARKAQTDSHAVKTSVIERAEYFLSERDIYIDVIGEEFVPQPIPEDPRGWRLEVSVSLGELTREDVEYIWERAKALQMGRHFIHTASEVDRYQHCEAIQRFNFYDTEGRNKKLINSIQLTTVDFMKELVRNAETLQSLYQKVAATTPAPSTTVTTTPKRKTKEKSRKRVKLTDVESKIVAALHAHHFGGTSSNDTPLKVSVIASKAGGVAVGSVTNFFKKWVLHRIRKPDGSYERTEKGSYAVYERMCKDLGRLERLLASLVKGNKNYKETGQPKRDRPSVSTIKDTRPTNTNSLGDDNPLDDRIDAAINARSAL